MPALEMPADQAALIDIVADARAAKTPIDLVGGGSKRGWGGVVQAGRTVSLAAIKGVTLYRPTELVVSAKAGTPLADLQATLAEEGQRLPFEPADYRRLLGTRETTPTIGGTVATNLAGPARVVLGAVRDLLLGVKAVNGRAEAITSGGRVMKNVTGYDIAKLTAGSFGTLAALTEVTFKVLPIPERSVTLVIPGLSDEDARAVMSRGLGSPFEVNAAAHLPAAAAAASGVERLSALGTAATLLRIEGFSDSLTYRLDAIRPELETDAQIQVAEGADSQAIWQAVRDVHPFAEPADRAVWKISTAPTEGPALAAAIAREIDATAFYDWGGGLVWLSVAPEVEDAGMAAIRAATAKVGGHATMVRGPESLRRAGKAMPPVDPVIARLSANLKESFDPDRILNPGRI